MYEKRTAPSVVYVMGTGQNFVDIPWMQFGLAIKRVITESHDREAGKRFVITNLIADQNCTTRSAISTLLHSFLNLQVATLVCLQKNARTFPIL